jgi:predicted RNA-binding Zn-ribbon protein involved in translation (DUF1610 family)
MKIIRFPGHTKLDVSTSTDPKLRLSVGPVSFTCTSCGEETSANFHNMVFRTLEFYCLACGSPFRLTNPAFGTCSKK